MRNILANILFLTGISKLLFHLSLFFYGKDHIRVVNYHSTPENLKSNLDQQFSFFNKYYESVDLKEFEDFLSDKSLKRKKPGIIISFDDGLINNFKVAVPILETYGLTGWFCIPSEFHSIEPQDQFEYAKTHSLSLKGIDKSDEQVSMTIEDLKSLAREHELVSHTVSHARFNVKIDDKQLEDELVKSKSDLESITKKEINCFCWVGGELNSYSKKANEAIKRHYKLAFRTNNLPVLKGTNPFEIERSNLEAWFSYPLFLLTISGFYDFLYLNKRRKIKKILN